MKQETQHVKKNVLVNLLRKGQKQRVLFLFLIFLLDYKVFVEQTFFLSLFLFSVFRSILIALVNQLLFRPCVLKLCLPFLYFAAIFFCFTKVTIFGFDF